MTQQGKAVAYYRPNISQMALSLPLMATMADIILKNDNKSKYSNVMAQLLQRI
jgi:hypothetical protein